LGTRPRFLFRIVTRQRAEIEEKILFEKWLGAKWGRITYEEREPLPPIQAAESLFFRPKFV
jgi:hypothetical protein